jgi:hypothetical protein
MTILSLNSKINPKLSKNNFWQFVRQSPVLVEKKTGTDQQINGTLLPAVNTTIHLKKLKHVLLRLYDWKYTDFNTCCGSSHFGLVQKL